ncbi:hypothetical protein LJC63_05865 [Ruminococcaceae bacterium OttesenSCG-928-L11]|nr:hypothetical protein [Ruminococcaceae bacterium OttesenSCG-928-L11]
MSKTMNRLLSLVLAVAMVLTLNVPALATDLDIETDLTIGHSGIITGFMAIESVKVDKGTPEDEIPFPDAVEAMVLPDGDDMITTPTQISASGWSCVEGGGYIADQEGSYSFEPTFILPEGVTLGEGVELPCVSVEVESAKVGFAPMSGISTQANLAFTVTNVVRKDANTVTVSVTSQNMCTFTGSVSNSDSLTTHMQVTTQSDPKSQALVMGQSTSFDFTCTNMLYVYVSDGNTVERYNVPPLPENAPTTDTLDLTFTSEDKVFIGSNGGTATWNQNDTILTLNNFQHETTAATAVELPGGANTTIVLNGANSIVSISNNSSEAFGIYAWGQLEIAKGDGATTATLNVNSGNSLGFVDSIGVNVRGNLIVNDGCTLTGVSGTSGRVSIGIRASGNITANGIISGSASKSYSNNYGVESYGDITVTNGSVTGTGAEATDAESDGVHVGKSITVNNGRLSGTGGDAYSSTGIYANTDISLLGSSTVEGNGSTASGGLSRGVHTDTLSVAGSSTAEGNGGTTNSADRASTGIYVKNITVAATATGSITGTGGTATAGDSIGIDVYNGSLNAAGSVTVKGTGGTASSSFGIYVSSASAQTVNDDASVIGEGIYSGICTSTAFTTSSGSVKAEGGADDNATDTLTYSDPNYEADYTVAQYVKLTAGGSSLATAPTVTATAGDGEVELSWTAVADADGYKIYMNGQEASTVASSPATIPGLTNGTEYTFEVEAVDNNGQPISEKGMIKTTPVAASSSALDYSIYFDGEKFRKNTSDGDEISSSDLPTGLSVEGGVLKLNSVSLTSSAVNALILPLPTTVELTGTNTIRCEYDGTNEFLAVRGINAVNGMTVKGSGTLNAIAARTQDIGLTLQGIYATNLTVEEGANVNASVETTGNTSDIYGIWVDNLTHNGTGAIRANATSGSTGVMSGIYVTKSISITGTGKVVGIGGNFGAQIKSADGIKAVGTADVSGSSPSELTFENGLFKAGSTYAKYVEMTKASGGSLLDAPTVTATAGDGKVELSWTEVTGAYGYKIYMNSQVASTVASSPATIQGLTNGTESTFGVEAVDNSGQPISKKGEVKATPTAGGSGTAPSATVSDKTVTGKVGEAMQATEITVTLVNDKISKDVENTSAYVTGMVQNLLPGLEVKAANNLRKGDTSFILCITGTPTVAASGVIRIKISGGILEGGNSIITDENANTKWSILGDGIPTNYTVSVSASPSNGGSVSGSGTFAENTSQTVTATANSNYRFTGWTENGAAVSTSASYTFTLTGNRNLVANFTYTGGSVDSSDSDSGSSDRDSGSSTASTPTPNPWLEPNPAQTLSNDANSKNSEVARTKSSDTYGVRKASWSKFAEGQQYQHDTMDGNAVAVRLYIGNPTAMNRDTYVTGHISGSAVEKRKTHFEKWFSNKLQVIHMDESESWGQKVEIAAKVDLSGMDTDNLYIYSYDAKTNSYTRVSKEKYWIDKNGYLHFYTELAGDIIISDGELEKK